MRQNESKIHSCQNLPHSESLLTINCAIPGIPACASMSATSNNNNCMKKTLKRTQTKTTKSSSPFPSSLSSQLTINRLQLFATVKILLQFLSKEKPHLRYVAQKVLKDCYKQHQNNRNNSVTLAELIERRLRETVGEKCWRIAKTMQHRQCSISLNSINKQKNQSEFIVTRGRGNEDNDDKENNNKITLIVPLIDSNNK